MNTGETKGKEYTMGYQSIFKRYELKYMLTSEQKKELLNVMKQYMSLDKYGRTVIRNIYFDTDTYRLIRKSIEKPVYKEKLRIRSYSRTDKDTPVFVELKKKYKSVVYKRRVSVPEQQAVEWICSGTAHPGKTQITDEIDYFLSFYETLHPVVFLSYEREAFYSLDGGDFRITFDENILSREDELSLESEIRGDPLLKQNNTLMEIKTSGGFPLWLTRFLSDNNIYKTSFSKYGTAYRNIILVNQIH